MRVATIVGNRPQFIKAAAVSAPLRERHEELLVHTGQHYDELMSDVFFAQLDVPAPDHWIEPLPGAGGSEQTAHMLAALAPLLRDARPDVVLVYGDTNSTLAGALAAAQLQLPLAHVEAGMRSYDRTMPEELNRVVTDHLADLLLCSSGAARDNLAREGLEQRALVTGDVMVDVADRAAPLADALAGETLAALGVEAGAYVLATAHRAGNVDDPQRLRLLVALLVGLDERVVFPLHPRTRARLNAAGLLVALERAVRVCDPLGYLELAAVLRRARAVLTDSGGLQKEAYLAGVPCMTLRDRTEWTETVDAGWNVLVDLDPDAARDALALPRPSERPPLYGDGHAAERVVEALSATAPGRRRESSAAPPASR